MHAGQPGEAPGGGAGTLGFQFPQRGIDSGTLASGAAYRKKFTAPGTYDFLCALHSDMRGSIRVKDTKKKGNGGNNKPK